MDRYICSNYLLFRCIIYNINYQDLQLFYIHLHTFRKNNLVNFFFSEITNKNIQSLHIVKHFVLSELKKGFVDYELHCVHCEGVVQVRQKDIFLHNSANV